MDRACKQCGVIKPLSEFRRHYRCKDGHRSTCKECANAQDRARYQEVREERVAAAAAYRKANPEKVRQGQKRYAEKNKEKIRERRRQYFPEHYEKNREAYIERAAKWKQANRERVRELVNASRKLNREAVIERERRYRLAHPEMKKAEKARRRAAIANAPGSHTRADVRAVVDAQKWKCAACRVSLRCGYHMDHIIPLARGGSNDKLNLQALCRDCNLSKHAKDPLEFMQSRGYLL